MKVLVLGGSGMLGSMVLDVLAQDRDLQVQGTARPAAIADQPGTGWAALDAEQATPSGLAKLMDGFDWAVNCIGIIKHTMDERQAGDVERAVRVNALFPHVLAQGASAAGCRVLQIATDCVYSGTKGGYLEADPHDALDAYGKTKSLGEVPSGVMHHLRCSIIGPEQKGRRSLLEWFLGQPEGGKVAGYTNHRWNGVTTLHFARICQGVIKGGSARPGLCHVVPGNALSKGRLLQEVAAAFGRTDLHLELAPAAFPVDRTLHTSHPGLNRGLWAAAGYPGPPSLETMVRELAQHIQTAKEAHP
jgi:dTDP-4-dehydrorhamnose reductase